MPKTPLVWGAPPSTHLSPIRFVSGITRLSDPTRHKEDQLFVKTLPNSIPTTPTTLFNPISIIFRKPTKQFSLSLQKPTFLTSPFVVCVAQTSDWEQDSSLNALLVEETVVALNGEIEGESGGFGGEGGFSEPPEDAKLFVGNLPYDVDGEKLANLFDEAGVVEIDEEWDLTSACCSVRAT